MKILFAGGGTAGHINPAIAVAGYIKSKHPDAQIVFIGTKRGLESRLVPAAGYEFHTIDVEGFQRKLSLENIKRNISAVSKLMGANRAAKQLIKQIKPDVVVGTGGYVSAPVLSAAAKLGIKCCIHEQNAFAGKTNKMLAGRVDAVMLAMPEAAKFMKPKAEPILVGNPVRQSLIDMKKADARRALGLDSRPVILSFGGSLGARRINETVADVIAAHWKSGKYVHFHATGKYGTELMPRLLAQKGVDTNAENLHITEYIDNMDYLLPAADLVICRAGAITVSELSVQGKPAILIPSPNVAENHQFYNAMTLVGRDAAMLIEEKYLTGERLTQATLELIGDTDRLEKMHKASLSGAIFDVNERMYRVIMELYAAR